ncbi:colicin E1 family microcin immunity protein [Morganella morganii]|uniref:colicin E1 family microcin immunity protein n=1 Tax=Morganella morganii TaxID=582 RepID=UPI003EC082E2
MESEHKYKYIILFISVVGIGLYPLAKWCVEWFFLKFTTREFWNSGFFMETQLRSNPALAGYFRTEPFVYVFTHPIKSLIYINANVRIH